MIGAPGPMELVLLLVLVMIFFGVGKLPEVGKALGKSIRGFKDAQKDDSIDVTPQISAGAESVDVGAETMRQPSNAPIE
ncbi:MAG: twin-arginine translocase TatA/TatE family subunit [Deltaproteobacteria bacterium]|nr:twin-arginine translocase TatA/TatE family subunit [Deltaproteobacteria bacterium]